MASPRNPPSSSPGAPPPRRIPARSAAPSVLELARLSTDPIFPPGGEALYQQIALQTELARDQVVLDAACGRGMSTEFLASSYGVETHGFDPDPALVEEAERRTRTASYADLLHFEEGDLDDLPYQD